MKITYTQATGIFASSEDGKAKGTFLQIAAFPRSCQERKFKKFKGAELFLASIKAIADHVSKTSKRHVNHMKQINYLKQKDRASVAKTNKED